MTSRPSQCFLPWEDLSGVCDKSLFICDSTSADWFDFFYQQIFALKLLVCHVRYHTGTLAFGSLILSIIQIIRVLLEYLDHKLKGIEHCSGTVVLMIL